MSNSQSQTPSECGRAYFAAILFACACLLCNAAFFGVCSWNGTFAGIFAGVYGKSAAIDVAAAAAFIAGFAPFQFFRFKAFGSAGFFAYWQYCAGVDSVHVWAAVAAWTLIGLLSVRLPASLTIALGLLAFAASVWWNLTAYNIYGI